MAEQRAGRGICYPWTALLTASAAAVPADADSIAAVGERGADAPQRALAPAQRPSRDEHTRRPSETAAGSPHAATPRTHDTNKFSTETAHMIENKPTFVPVLPWEEPRRSLPCLMATVLASTKPG
ncbi:hypothetical protein GCM10027028_34690 [Streptomyces sundarbansensis]